VSSLAVVPDCPYPRDQKNLTYRSLAALPGFGEWPPADGCAYRNNTHEVEEKRSAAYGCNRFSMVLLHN